MPQRQSASVRFLAATLIVGASLAMSRAQLALRAEDPPTEHVLQQGHSGTMAAAVQPVRRTDANSKLAHEQMLANLKKGRIDAYFSGDSITRRWRATDYPQFLAHWNQNFFGWNAANFGWGGDTIQNI